MDSWPSFWSLWFVGFLLIDTNRIGEGNDKKKTFCINLLNKADLLKIFQKYIKGDDIVFVQKNKLQQAHNLLN